MRIVLKPIGFLFIVFAMLGLAIIAFRRGDNHESKKSGNSPVVVLSSSAAPPVSQAELLGGGELTNPVRDGGLVNGSFEDPFAVARYLGKGAAAHLRLTGDIARGWSDNSDWADVDIHYAQEKDPTQVAVGKTCQRIEIGSVRAGGAQMAQVIQLTPGRKWRASVRLKASREVMAGFGIYQLSRDGKVIKLSDVKLGPKWQQFQVDFSSPSEYDLFIVNCFQPNVTIWVDDAALKPLPK